MEKLFLGGFFTGEKLDVVKKEQVDASVEPGKFKRLLLGYSVNEIVCELRTLRKVPLK